ncbi:putative disease resistance protein RGA1 isoform X2 [Pistacia vera]|uniref:putative disease resistance protein RGA1 isoform X2 n=1 Tax=Pistacia vera TaxID=55513 RepID=UPI00126303A4|nr:putative disease resistance protein RGA1 isoform X2 [Pistacia vera]
MAEALVSIVLDQLASIGHQRVGGRIRLIAGVEQEVEKLQSNFVAIQAVVADAENRQLKENVVRDWLEKLKNISYDIDDALDEWNTKILLKEAENKYASKPLKKD